MRKCILTGIIALASLAYGVAANPAAGETAAASAFGKPVPPGWECSKQVELKNFNDMYQPCVVQTAGECRYKMWFFGWAAKQTNPKPEPDRICAMRRPLP